MTKTKVYIASPYSNGNKEELVQLQIDAAYHLLRMRFNPYMPLYNHFIQTKYDDLNHDFDWLGLDKSWLEECDIMVRLHPKNELGEDIPSPGADEEEAYALKLNIPVIHCDSIEELIKKIKEFDPEILQY